MLAVTRELANPVEINAHAFMTLSKLAFSSVERLATLNLNATRAALEGGSAAVGSLLRTGDAKQQQALLQGTPATVGSNAAAYLRGVQEIAAETQAEVARLISSYFPSQAKGSDPSAGCLKGFDMFKGFAQQITDMTAANIKLTGDATAHPSASAITSGKQGT